MSATAALFAEAFRDAALITGERAAQVLGLDEKTFRGLVKQGAIEPTMIGQRARFTEASLCAFLTGVTKCQSTSRKRARTTITTSPTKVVGITDLRTQRLLRQQGRSSSTSA